MEEIRETEVEREHARIKFAMFPVYESLKRIQSILENRIAAKERRLTSIKLPELFIDSASESEQEKIVKEELAKIGNFVVATGSDAEGDPSHRQLW